MLYQRQSQPQSAKRKSKDGDWICIQCFNYNYAFRDYCNRCRFQQRRQNQRMMSAIGKENYGQNSFPSVLFLTFPYKQLKQGLLEQAQNQSTKILYRQKTFDLRDKDTTEDLDAILSQNIWISNLIDD